MSTLQRRLRSLLIALAVLALSAGVALAGRGTHPTLAAGSQPAAQGADNEGDEAAETEDADPPEVEAPEADTDEGAGADEPVTGGTADQPTTEHPDNHGKLVSEAAQAETPAEFDNHGAYVKTVAGANHGHDQAAAAKAKHAPKARSH